LNEHTDSTIAPFYFKKCTEKPNASAVKIKLSSSISDFPFMYTFNCSEKISLASNETLNLQNWFSFIISKQTLPKLSTHDYYFYFDFTDSYNFLLDFDTSGNITNSADFKNNINNDFFDLESEIIKNTKSNYLLKVKLVVKERKITLDKMQLLTELLNALEALNNFSLMVKKV